MSQYTVPVIVGTGLQSLMMHPDLVLASVSFSRQPAANCAATLVHTRASLLLALAVASLALWVTTTR